MKCDKKMMLLYAVTDRAWMNKRNLYEQVEAALKNGVTCVQLREKELDDEAFLQEAMEIGKLCREYHVPFIINDNVEIAVKCGADGIHVGQEDMVVSDVRKRVGDNMIIGVSAHTVEEAVEAVKNGADYLGLGAVFNTSTKNDADNMSAEILKSICNAVHIPTVAIGGISSKNIMQLSGSGVDGVAVVSAIFGAEDSGKATAELLALAEKMVNSKIRTVLSIAGSDSSGGAGIQADIKTMVMNGVYAMTAITALTAQNTTGVSAIMEVTPEFLIQQIDAVFEDIRPDAVKIGMVSSPMLVEVIAERLKYYNAPNVVVDPVMVATSGSVLSKDSAVTIMKEKLIPLATVITPNIPEAEILCGRKIVTKEDMEQAAKDMSNTFGCAVLCKGGHCINDADDMLYANGKYTWFNGKRIDNPNTHGTGCTLSSAIASNLAKGYPLEQSIERAKAYISGALASMMDLGHGSGPLDHIFDVEGRFRK